MNLTYGSQGEEVRKLQEALNSAGYGLSTDGIYGSKTQAAVRDYQSKNGLSVDGIAGTNTLGKLYGTSGTSGTGSTTGSAATTGDAEVKAPEAAQPTGYQEGDAVTQAKNLLQQQMSQKPGAYDSQWQKSLDEILNKINNREEFSYDLNGDALYQQYKDRYVQQGQQAMMDTMGQAAALTGGYGNSYAQTAGQQTYQGYLQGLNDKVPELYQLALDRYNQQGQDLYNQYALLGDRENLDYNRYRDTVSDYNAELERLYNQYNTERDYDYGKYADARDFQYQTERDKTADEQWKTEFDEAVRQFNFANGAGSGSSGGGGGSSGGSGGSGGGGNGGSDSSYSGTSGNPGYTKAQIMALQAAAGITVDGIWGPQTAAAYASGIRPSAEETKEYTGGNTTSYDQVVTDLNTYISRGASKSQINTALRLALNGGKITQAEYSTLKATYAPAGSTY